MLFKLAWSEWTIPVGKYETFSIEAQFQGRKCKYLSLKLGMRTEVNCKLIYIRENDPLGWRLWFNDALQGQFKTQGDAEHHIYHEMIKMIKEIKQFLYWYKHE